MWFFRAIFQLIGLSVVVWFIFIAGEEYAKLRRERKEAENDH